MKCYMHFGYRNMHQMHINFTCRSNIYHKYIKVAVYAGVVIHCGFFQLLFDLLRGHSACEQHPTLSVFYVYLTLHCYFILMYYLDTPWC